ncbi:MAG: Alpha-acetolactate decarboxylase [Methanomassiliicoccales archaeon PtaB.Bin134]|jgi:acetolactate decarboxylase|nr:MAG: Alpha-acetolactate decarboxylase [Methanomassiliicoccales archaeon PtaB.Bin134]
MVKAGELFTVVGVAILVMSGGLVGYWAAPGEPAAESNSGVYFQVSTYERLNHGGFGGGMAIGELLEHGDHGIGTVEGIDGEMIILDGVAYRAGTDLRPVEVPEGTMVPFVQLVEFNFGLEYQLVDIDDYSELRERLGSIASSGYLAYGILIDATFLNLTIRSVPGQQEPYPPLADVVANQTVMELHGVQGTMVGFLLTDGLAGINVPGFHLHFISDDRNYAGHVLDMAFDLAYADVCHMDQCQVVISDR